MSFNNRNFNPNIWDPPRTNNPPPLFNIQQQQNFRFNFQHQNRPNFFQQGHGNNQMRPQGPFSDDRPNFRKFNNPDYRNNNIQQQRGGRNFQNVPPPKWIENRSSNDVNQRSNDNFENTNSRSPLPSQSADESRSIVEQLKIKAAKINTKQQQQQQEGSSNSENIDASAKNASKKLLLNELKATDKGDIKDLINNPKQPHVKAAITYHALEKLRRGMRKQLKTLGGAEDDTDFFDAQDSVELKDIPQTLIAQMGHELGVDDMDLSSFDEVIVEDKEMAVVEKNLGNDFLLGSEELLMNGFSLLGESENEPDLPPPPLPSEVIKPPEPVPPPSQEAAFSSNNKAWLQAPSILKSNTPSQQKFYEDEWNIDSAKNPDPPSAKSNSVPKQAVNRSRSETPSNDILPIVDKVKAEAVVMNSSTPLRDEGPNQQMSQVSDWDADESVRATPFSSNGQQQTPTEMFKQESLEQEQQAQSARSNETYGDYKRRNYPPNNNNNNNNNNRNNFNKPRPLNQQNRGPNRAIDWDADEIATPRSTGSNDNWINNNKRNNNNNDRASRQDVSRSRDNNNFNNRNNSRDRWSNTSCERPSNDPKDGFNYRVDSMKEVGADNFNAIIQPKTQFKGSFNKNRMGPRDFMNRNKGREKTPTNNDGDFGDLMTMPSSSTDARPCSFMLKKVIEFDSEMMSIHEKIHGIDKVIQNLQSERVSYQKKYSQLQHDRKVIFENLLKRSHYNETSDRAENHGREQLNTRDKSHTREKSPQMTQKASANKKLQNMADQKKRKVEPEPVVEEPPKKKRFIPVEEPKSAAQRQKEKDEKELKERLEKIRKQKQLRRDKEEAERRRLEAEALKASNEVIIKLEKGGEKSKKSQKQNEQPKTEKASKITFDSSEFLQVTNYKVKMPGFSLKKVTLSQSDVDSFKSGRFPQISREDWHKWSLPVKEEPRIVSTEVEVTAEVEKDPLALDDQPLTKPPTPGSNLTVIENEEIPTEEQISLNYDEWNGNFNSHQSPIVYLQNIDGQHMVCAAEDGKLFKYRLTNGHVDGIFDYHSQICNAFLYDHKEDLIYTASSDGYVFRVKFKSFEPDGSRNFSESLQVIEKSKSTIYVGTKSGKIFKAKSDLTIEDDEESNEPLCCVEGLILCLKASKEGPRSILLVASRGKAIQVRDASDGLLLRTLANELSNVSVYDMALDGSTIYCGCNLHDIFAIDFTNGALKKKRKMLGAGAICVKIYKQFLIAACYDGNIYIFNIESDEESAVNITGPSNMLLAMDLWDDKMIASTKDKTVKIMNIPT